MDDIAAFPVSCGALLLDDQGRLLILKPTYKSGWTIPGGITEGDETPWQGCRREVLEETGITVTDGRLVAVDTKAATHDEPLSLRFLFHCGTVSDEQVAGMRLQRLEVAEHRWTTPDEALPLLRKRIRRRVGAALDAGGRCVYLEDGRLVDGVGAP